MGRDGSQAPLFVSITDAARLLGISRSTAYALAHAWLDSDGEHGLPCVRLRRRIIVPRAAIETMAAVGTPGEATA